MDLQLWAERLAVEEWAGLGWGRRRRARGRKDGAGMGAVKQGAGSREESTEEQRRVQGIGNGAGGQGGRLEGGWEQGRQAVPEWTTGSAA